MPFLVSLVLDLFLAGMTADEIIADYPALEKENLQSCLLFASRLSETKTFTKFPRDKVSG